VKPYLFRTVTIILKALIGLMAVHVFSVLGTGGYTLSFNGVSINAFKLAPPLVILSALVILYFPCRYRSFSSEVFSTHAGLILFAVFLMFYMSNDKVPGGGDTVPARYLPISILREHNFDLDEFPFLYESGSPHYLRYVNGHYVSVYPIGPAVAALPFYLPSALGSLPLDSRFFPELEKFAAASLTALSAVILYFTLMQATERWFALLITMVYALGTSSFSTSS